jgi:uncharacterized protein YoaH (UPF0181 family)
MSGAAPDQETRRVIAALFAYADRLLNAGQTPTEVERELMAKGLDRGPAATIVAKVVSERARQAMERDRQEAQVSAASTSSGDAGGNIALGAIICVIGILVTVVSYSSAAGGGTYVVAWGAIVFGAIRMFKGFAQAGSSPGAAHLSGGLPEPMPTASPPALLLPSSLESVVVLLMSQEQLGARVDTDAMVTLTRAVEADVAGLYWRGEIEEGPLALFVLVKPDRRCKVWAEGIDRELSAKDAAVLETHTAAWKAPDVRGIISLAFTYQRKGKRSAGPPQLPRAWRDAAAKAGRTLELPDGLAAAVWPD